MVSNDESIIYMYDVSQFCRIIISLGELLLSFYLNCKLIAACKWQRKRWIILQSSRKSIRSKGSTPIKIDCAWNSLSHLCNLHRSIRFHLKCYVAFKSISEFKFPLFSILIGNKTWFWIIENNQTTQRKLLDVRNGNIIMPKVVQKSAFDVNVEMFYEIPNTS